ncbi:hypothetical protein D3C85_664930 [compost metagenome]
MDATCCATAKSCEPLTASVLFELSKPVATRWMRRTEPASPTLTTPVGVPWPPPKL